MKDDFGLRQLNQDFLGGISKALDSKGTSARCRTKLDFEAKDKRIASSETLLCICVPYRVLLNCTSLEDFDILVTFD